MLHMICITIYRFVILAKDILKLMFLAEKINADIFWKSLRVILSKKIFILKI